MAKNAFDVERDPMRADLGSKVRSAAFAGTTVDPRARRGRGAGLNPSGRFEREAREVFDDGWELPEEVVPARTTVIMEAARSIVTRNQSPDISFDRSLNPYRGCEHGCIYCYARPSHAHMGLSPGLDFETQLFAKPQAAALLRRELAKPGYAPRTLAIGTNTDPYQPIERDLKIMRAVLKVLDETNHPVGIVTKSALIIRDIDILASMAERGLAKVAVSITTQDRALARAMEPRAATPDKRFATIERLSAAGIPTAIMTAPIIPALNDMEIDRLLKRAAACGAREAGYVLLRLPREVSPLFRDWLARERPEQAARVMALVQSTRGGRDYDSDWAQRKIGRGPYSWTIGRRFELAAQRNGLNRRRIDMRTDLFTPPGNGRQLTLF